MNRSGRVPGAFRASLLIFLTALGALLSAFLPLVMIFGLATGGVLESGQADPGRWSAGAALALLLLSLLSWRWDWRARFYWLAIFSGGLASAVLLIAHGAAVGRREGGVRQEAAPQLRVGVVSALPLFWPEGAEVRDLLADGAGEAPLSILPPVTHHAARAIDHVDGAALEGLDALLLAQPRLLQPQELVQLDQWVREGGRMVVLADPLLAWPSELPSADPRRPPLTSLLDPLLTHWGLRLEPARQGVERRMLASGHALMLVDASRFTLLPVTRESGAACSLAEQALMALCRIGRGEVRLVADADMLDPRLWLADPRWPDRREAWSADIPDLIDGWLAAPLRDPSSARPYRVKDEQALMAALRWALVMLLGWAGLGGVGQKRILSVVVPARGGRCADKQRAASSPSPMKEKEKP